MLRMDECRQTPGGGTLFFTSDISSGYWKIKVTDDDRDETAIKSCYDHFMFVRMAYGLSAPGKFRHG